MSDRERILAVVAKVAGKEIQPEPGQALFDSGVLDSFALPDVVAGLEQEFGIQVPDSDLNPRKFESLERIEAYLHSRA